MNRLAYVAIFFYLAFLYTIFISQNVLGAVALGFHVVFFILMSIDLGVDDLKNKE